MKNPIYPNWATWTKPYIETNKASISFYKDIHCFFRDTNSFLTFLSKAPPYYTYDIYDTSSIEELKNAGLNPNTVLHSQLTAHLLALGYSSTYKLKNYAQTMAHSISQGNLLLAASCARAIVEHSGHLHYFYKRIEKSLLAIRQRATMKKRSVMKGIPPDAAWMEKFIKDQFDVIRLCQKALDSGRFDWTSHFDHTFKRMPNEPNENRKIASKSMNTLGYLDELPPIKNGYTYWYNAMCDLVHPNRGSYFLVMDVREKKAPLVFQTTLSEKPVNADAFVVLMSVIAIPLASLFRLAMHEITGLIDTADALRNSRIDHLSKKPWVSDYDAN